MAPLAIAYVSGLVIFVVVDLAWLSFIAPRFYRPIMGDIMAPWHTRQPSVRPPLWIRFRMPEMAASFGLLAIEGHQEQQPQVSIASLDQ